MSQIEEYLAENGSVLDTDTVLHLHKVDMLNFTIIFSIGKDADTSVSRVDKSFIDPASGSAYCKGMTITNEDLGVCVICIPFDASLNTITHEAVHAAGFIHQVHDLHYSFDHDETMAYMVGYIVDGALDAIEIYNKKTNLIKKPNEQKRKKPKQST